MNVLESFSLQRKVALIVGGSGLYGMQICAALSEAGAKTYVTTRKQDQVAALQEKFAAADIQVTVEYLDQSKEETTIALRDKLLDQEGQIDILVNNAVARTMDGWDDDTDKFAESMAVNATGIYSLTKIFGNVMQKQGSGSIIQIGSMQGMIGPDSWLYEGKFPASPDYFFHKGGMINFTKYVASYYGLSGVRCNCISPGGIKSYRTSDEFVERYSTRTMLGRMANDTDLKGIVVFLASDASLYVTGANIPVDGGYTAK